MLRVIAECRPRFILAENVRGAINLALDTVQSGMEGEGYEVKTLLLPAAAFGAPHKRERMFVVGVREDVAYALSGRLSKAWPREQAAGVAGEGACCAVANSVSEGLEGGKWQGAFPLKEPPAPEPASECGEGGGALWPTPTVGTSGGGKLCGGTGHLNMLRDALGYEEARKLSAGNGGQLNPEWVEILMGFPIGWTDPDCDEPEPWPGWPALMGEPQFDYEPHRTVSKCDDRAKRLKCLGNAVVPQQAIPLFEAIAAMGNSLEGAVGKLDENGMEVEE